MRNNLENKINNLLEDKRVLSSIALVVLTFFITFLIFVTATRPFSKEEPPVVTKKDPSIFFNDLKIEGESAIVWDVLNQKTIYSKNERKVLPLASITKVLTAITALETISESTVITIQNDFLNEEGDTGLVPGESWNLRDLLNFGLIMSSNDAAAAVSSVVGKIYSGASSYDLGNKEFISKMNRVAEKIGMEDSLFYNSTGLDLNKTESGAYSSALDVAKLFSYTLYNHENILTPTRNDHLVIASLTNILHKAINTNPSVNKVPNVLASKTGYTDLSGGNLAMVIDPGIGRPFVVVVLGSTIDGRFSDIEKISTAVLAYLQSEQ